MARRRRGIASSSQARVRVAWRPPRLAGRPAPEATRRRPTSLPRSGAAHAAGKSRDRSIARPTSQVTAAAMMRRRDLHGWRGRAPQAPRRRGGLRGGEAGAGRARSGPHAGRLGRAWAVQICDFGSPAACCWTSDGRMRLQARGEARCVRSASFAARCASHSPSREPPESWLAPRAQGAPRLAGVPGARQQVSEYPEGIYSTHLLTGMKDFLNAKVIEMLLASGS